MALAAAQIHIADPDNSGDTTTFDIDPASYDPLNAPLRGSVHKMLDGSTLTQVLGVFPQDFVLQVQGTITDLDTLKALWTKYINTGKTWKWTDWYGHEFQVVFAPGGASFHPQPVVALPETHHYTMTLNVVRIVKWFGNSYG